MLDLKNTVKIEIDWRSEKSIELAEKAKLDLENELTVSALVYAKEK